MIRAMLALLLTINVVVAAEPPSAAEQSPAQRPEAATSRPAAASSAQAADEPQTAPARRTNDRLDLETTVVTGNRELPKVLYIVPWKKAELGELPAQPFNTLLDEVLTPVDRDVFRREVTYYGAVAAGAGAADAERPGASGDGTEK